MLTTLDLGKTSDRCLAVVQHDLHVRTHLAEQRTHDAFSLLKHRAEKMLGLDLLILIAFSELDSRLNRFLSTECEFV